MMTRKLPRNPYIAGRTVTGGRGFFGREDVFRFVRTTLESPGQNVTILYGQRRIGKTSILLELEQRLMQKGYVPVYVDLMHHARTALNDLLKEIALRIQAKVQIPNFDLNNRTEQKDWFQAKFLTAIKSSLKDKQQLVLLFDEFDVLDKHTQSHLPSVVAADTFFPYLYNLITVEDNIQFVVVIGRKSEDLSLEARSTLKSATFKRISVLPKEDAFELILQASKIDALYFEDNVPEAIFALTAGHPYLTQLLCSTLFERAWSSKPDEPPTVSLTEVEESIPLALERGKNAMEWIWDGLPAAEKVVFAALAGARERVVSTTLLESILKDYGVQILLRSLELAPDTLVEWELLRKEEEGYTFFVELIRHWVAANKPAKRVKDELDNVDQLAKSLFETGEFFYRTGELEAATEQLKRVLQINPNHLKARLLLGEVLRDFGQTDAAVRELEQAYRYDAEASRTALLRALIVHGEVLEDKGEIEEALSLYRRALEIVPDDNQAKRHLMAVLYQQANELLQALHFYEASTLYQEILHIDPGGAEAKTKLNQLRDEEWLLATYYSKVSDLINEEKWDEAQVILDKIASIDPNYRDIAEKFSFVERHRKSPDTRIAIQEFLQAFWRLPPVAKGGVIALIFLISGMISWPFMFPEPDAVILAAELNLRQAPSLTQYRVIETLPKGTKLSVLG
ncbi:MAG: tetratricopeptide repeat protein [Candidatus Hodarchaeota archaeon]